MSENVMSNLNAPARTFNVHELTELSNSNNFTIGISASISSNYWETINEKAIPSHFLKLDWASYDSLNFGDAFLPKAANFKQKNLIAYDAGSLFNIANSFGSKQFTLKDCNEIVQTIFSFPSSSLASKSTHLINLDDNEICSFFIINKDESITLQLKVGTKVLKAIKLLCEQKNINVPNFNEGFTTNITTVKNDFKNGLTHFSMLLFILKKIGFTELDFYKLDFFFAPNQLKLVATQMGKSIFSTFLANIYGKDIETKAIEILYDHLINDTLDLPKIIITSNDIDGHKAGYNNETKEILLWQQFVDEAIENENKRAELLIALVEEYGHHLDNLLRTDFSSVKIDDNDTLDEGAKFALFFLTPSILQIKDFAFANLLSPMFNGQFITTLPLINQELEKINYTTNLYDAKPNAKIENFGAGFEEGLHGGIELKAFEKIFERDEIYKIYYGNWLRDYSQLLVGSTLRVSDTSKKAIEEEERLRNDNALVALKTQFSQEGWVKMIQILAAKEFHFEKKYGVEKFCLDYKGSINEFVLEYGEMTKDILGVYRPEEHIDNPMGLENESMLPLNFQYEFPKGKTVTTKLYCGENYGSLDIDNGLMLKNYIHKNISDDRPSSDRYISQQIMLAAQYGNTTAGYRHLGAALHVIEDFFAHSNFVELALRKAGTKNTLLKDFTKVYPWVQGLEDYNFDKIPIVTGKFLIDDTFASIIPKLAEKLFPINPQEYEQRKAGDRTFGDAFILTLLEDLVNSPKMDTEYYGLTAKQYLDAYNGILGFIDLKCKAVSYGGRIGRYIDKSLHSITELILNTVNIVFNILMGSAGYQIKEAQSYLKSDNYGSNPTHTQIAKDEKSHLLNPLASTLALEAIKDIGTSMKAIWETKIDINGNILAKKIIEKYTMHPFKTTWEEKIVNEWADKNTKIASRLSSPTFLKHIEKKTKSFYNDFNLLNPFQF